MPQNKPNQNQDSTTLTPQEQLARLAAEVIRSQNALLNADASNKQDNCNK
jgi:hypothetical protein